MAWPKKGTRKLVVDGEAFLWHYSGCCLFCSFDVFTLGKAGAPYVLYVDPTPWAFIPTPREFARAVRWARARGWSAESGPTRAMAMVEHTTEYQWLPDRHHHLACANQDVQGLANGGATPLA